MVFALDKNPTRARTVGVATLAASLAIVLTTWDDPISKENVEAYLSRFADHTAAYAAKSGKEGKFSYGELEMRGILFSGYAVVKDAKLEIKRPSLIAPVTWAFATPEFQVLRDHLNARRIYYTFNSPVSYFRNGEHKANITFSEPLKYGHMQKRRGSGDAMFQSYVLPASITIAPPGGTEEQAVVITYDPDSTIETMSMLDHSERKVHYAFRNLVVRDNSEKPFSIESLASDLSEAADDDGVLKGTYVMNMVGMRLAGEEKACDAQVDVAYTGDEPWFRLTGFAPSLPGLSMEIKDAALECPEFSVNLDGTMTREGDDQLPSGQLKLKLVNVKELLSSGLLDEGARKILSQVLVKVTGQPVEDLTQVEVPLKRERGGTFYIGDLTFEELATSLLSDMLNFNALVPPANAQPMPPLEEKPAEPALPDPEATLLEEDPSVAKTSPDISLD